MPPDSDHRSPPSLDDLGRKYGTDKASNGHDYLRHYEFYFERMREHVSRIIEIGGLAGASLAMWTDYFPRAQIICIDVNPEVKRFQSDRVAIEIGNAGDRTFLKSIRSKYGTADIVIDDGSHRWDHQRIAFQVLFPMVAPDGFYIVEDLHSNYEANFSGNDEVPFITLLKDRLNFLNLRGKAREEYLVRYAKETQASIRAIESVVFIPRACLIKKKPSAQTSQRPRDYKPDQFSLIGYDELIQAGRAEPLETHGDTRITIIDPPCFGTFERPGGLRSIKSPCLYAVQLQDAVALPRQVLLSDLYVVPDTFRRANAKHEHTQLERIEDSKFRPKLPVKVRHIITEPVFYLDGEHMGHFGHFTLEVLSRLWYWDKYTASSSGRPRIVCSDLKPFALDFLKAFGITRNDIYLLDGPTLLKNVTVASQSYILERGVASSAFAVWRQISDFNSGGPTSRRIYVSRSTWAKQRVLLNEREVEKLFARYGFEIIHPENQSIAEQVSLFRGAEFIAGPSGSAMYNCVYSVKKGARLILASAKFVTSNDALINMGTGSAIQYVTGRPVDQGTGMLAGWEIDVGLVEDRLRKMLKEHESDND